jgi:uncharacterized membrane protein YraQ (UPF0718 family)
VVVVVAAATATAIPLKNQLPSKGEKSKIFTFTMVIPLCLIKNIYT